MECSTEFEATGQHTHTYMQKRMRVVHALEHLTDVQDWSMTLRIPVNEYNIRWQRLVVSCDIKQVGLAFPSCVMDVSGRCVGEKASDFIKNLFRISTLEEDAEASYHARSMQS